MGSNAGNPDADFAVDVDDSGSDVGAVGAGVAFFLPLDWSFCSFNFCSRSTLFAFCSAWTLFRSSIEFRSSNTLVT